MEIRTYSELIAIPSFMDRFRYLKLTGKIGEETFGFDRRLNQVFYRSSEWRKVRNYVIARDMGYDLGVKGFLIPGRVYVHHMNPLTLKDINQRREEILDPEFLISVSFDTHNAIHYADESKIVITDPVIRSPNDTCPWR